MNSSETTTNKLSLLEALFEEHVGAVYNVAFRVLFSNADAEDAVQQTFIKAYTKLDDLRKPGSARAWLLQIAYREAIGIIRRNKELTLDPDKINDHDTLTSPDPIDAVVAQTTSEIVAQALASMKEDERIAVVLRDIEDLPMNQVAEVLEVGLSAAKMRVHRGRQYLRVHLQRELNK